MFSVDSDDPINHSNDTSHSEGNTLNCNPNSLSSTSHSGSSTYHRNQTHSTHYDRGSHLNSSNNETSTGNSSRGSSESSQATNSGHCRVHMFKVHMPDQNAKERVGNERNGNAVESEVKYTWEYALMLPATPDEVRSEVDVLLSDLIVRLKQILFNSLLCAYYVGIIPMLFADVSEWCNRSIIIHIIHCSSAKLLFTFTYVHPDTHLHMFRCTHSHCHTLTPSQNHLYYDKWWCVEHAFLVWANSFVILSSHLFPPSYCQILYRCALHLGCWTRCVHDENAST